MCNRETLFFDESGTPAVADEDGLFVVGGFSIRGETYQVKQNWVDFMNAEGLNGKKGKKYTPHEFMLLSEFMCKNGIIPITGHSRLAEDDLRILESKIDIHNRIAINRNKNHLSINQHHYIWSMQVAITIGTSILSLAINRGVISDVQIAVDKYLHKKSFQEYIDHVLEKFFTVGEVERIFKSWIEQYPTHPDIVRLRKSFRPEAIFISLDWNARGKYALLADVVCSMYKRTLKGEPGVDVAWDILKICFTRDGKTPSCIGSDLTTSVKNLIRKPWIV